MKQVPTNHPDYARCEARAAELATRLDLYGQPLRVRRVYCDWINGSEVAAYTNSVILNRRCSSPRSALQPTPPPWPGTRS
ncbi:MAG: hypothetical protein IPK72_17610 [Candidatus Eisenbacteria bacterium]|nr:hypothetical protein [Candidatus Eisenbacteria bacterium]